jgi:hypothetical protein
MTRHEFKPGIKFKHRGVAHREGNPRECIFQYIKRSDLSHGVIEICDGQGALVDNIKRSWNITLKPSGFEVYACAGFILLHSKLIKFASLDLITESVTNQIPHNVQDNNPRLSQSAEISQKI